MPSKIQQRRCKKKLYYAESKALKQKKIYCQNTVLKDKELVTDKNFANSELCIFQRNSPCNVTVKTNKSLNHVKLVNKKTDDHRNSPRDGAVKINKSVNHVKLVNKTYHAKIDDGVKMCFYEYFKRGFYGDAAKSLHEHYLRKTNILFFKDKSMNPNLKAICELYMNWVKMNENIQADRGHRHSGSPQMAVTQKNGYSKIAQPTLQYLDFLNMDVELSKIRKSSKHDYTPMENNGNESDKVFYAPFVNIVNEATEDSYASMEIVNEALESDIFQTPVESNEDNTHAENITNKVVKAIEPILNIKQEIIDDYENDGLPVITNYGNVITMIKTNNAAVEDYYTPMENILDNDYAIVENTNKADYIPTENIVNNTIIDDNIPMENIVNKAAENSTLAKNITDKIVRNIQPVLNIKQEIIDEDENVELPDISDFNNAIPITKIVNEAVEDDYTPMENIIDEAIKGNHILVKNIRTIEDYYIPVENTVNEVKNEYIPVKNIVNKFVLGNKPMVNIKQEVIDEVESDGLQVISNYSSMTHAVNIVNEAVGDDHIPMESLDEIEDNTPVMNNVDDNYAVMENINETVEYYYAPVENTVYDALKDDNNPMENIINKDAENNYTRMKNTADKIVKDIQPLLNIKQEITDEDGNVELPVISNYGSITPIVKIVNEAIEDDCTVIENAVDEATKDNCASLDNVTKIGEGIYIPV